MNGQPLPGALDATYFASASQQDLARNAMLSWTRVWNPQLISETRAAFTRLVTSRVQADPNHRVHESLAGASPGIIKLGIKLKEWCHAESIQPRIDPVRHWITLLPTQSLSIRRPPAKDLTPASYAASVDVS